MNDNGQHNPPPDDTPDAATEEGRRLIVALELLARAVDKSTLAVLENLKEHATGKEPAERPPARPPSNYEAYQARKKRGENVGRFRSDKNYAKKGKGGRGVFGKLQSLLLARVKSPAKRRAIKAGMKAFGKVARAGKAVGGAVMGRVLQEFMRLLGPMALLNAVISSNAAGFELLGKGVRLLAAVFAPILLPVTVLMAAALLAVADVLWAKMLPALGSWFRFILAVGIPVIRLFVDAVSWAAKMFIKVGNGIIAFWNGVIGLANKVPGVNIPEIGHIPAPDVDADKHDPDAAVRKIVEEENARRDQRAPEHMRDIQDENRRAGRPDNQDPNDPDGLAQQALKRANAERDVRLAGQGVDPAAARRAEEKAIVAEEDARRDQREEQIKMARNAQNIAAGRPANPPDEVGVARQIADRERADRLRQRGIDPDPKPKPGGGGVDMKNVLGQVIQSLQMSHGPKATIGDLGGVRNQAQLAALNTDPFEARIEKMFQNTIDLLKVVAAELPDKPRPVMGN